MNKSVSFRDIFFAYRKAKSDLFWENNHPYSLRFILYERNLVENLEKLRRNINENDQCLYGQSFLGGHRFIPKSGSGNEDGGDPGITFRMISNHSVDFHIFSALWINKVGEKFDRNMVSNSFGSRLARDENGRFQRNKPGSFYPYTRQYKKWIDDGIAKAEECLINNQNITILTCDISEFYHRITPDVITDPFVINSHNVTLSEFEENINLIMHKCMTTWANATPLCTTKEKWAGLSIGLGAARIAANMALLELDKKIIQIIDPTYYGRYVDDIILICNTPIGSPPDWNPLQEIAKSTDEGTYIVQNNNAKSGIIEFKKEKTQLFNLTGSRGKRRIAQIKQKIRENSSEWRMLPDSERLFTSPGLSVDQAIHSLDANEGNEMKNQFGGGNRGKKYKVAVAIANLLEKSIVVPPDSWESERAEYVDVLSGLFDDLNTFVDFYKYVPKIISMLLVSRDYTMAKNFITKCCSHVDEIDQNKISISLAGFHGDPRYLNKNDIVKVAKSHFFHEIYDAVLIGNVGGIRESKVNDLIKIILSKSNDKFDLDTDINTISAEIFHSDLHKIPLLFKNRVGFELFKYHDLPNEEITRRLLLELTSRIKSDLHRNIIRDFSSKLGIGSAAPTRSGKLNDVSHLVFKGKKIKIHKIMSTLWGTRPDSVSKICIETLSGTRSKSISIGDPAINKRRTIAITCFKTETISWACSVQNKDDPDKTRYQRTNNLINSIMSCRSDIDYVVMHELALLPDAFYDIADSLCSKGIGLIAGVGYVHYNEDKISNQLWASLPVDRTNWFHYMQAKMGPALHEEEGIGNLGTKQFHCPSDLQKKFILNHNGFMFSCLICSEFTDIQNRTNLRGKVDSVMVPEWNQDTELFGSVVESAALDIHAYIIQVNNRIYNDSRIRSPRKNSYERDRVRLKGGDCDFFAISTIDYGKLREFQSRRNSSRSGLYKPTPDGFTIINERVDNPDISDL